MATSLYDGLFPVIPQDLHFEYYSWVLEQMERKYTEIGRTEADILYQAIEAKIERPLEAVERVNLCNRLRQDIEYKRRYEAEVAPKPDGENELDQMLIDAALNAPDEIQDLLNAGADPMAARSKALSRCIGDLNLTTARQLFEAGAENCGMLPMAFTEDMFNAVHKKRTEVVAKRRSENPKAYIHSPSEEDVDFAEWRQMWDYFMIPVASLCAYARGPRWHWRSIRKALTGGSPNAFAGVLAVGDGIGIFADRRQYKGRRSPLDIHYVYSLFVYSNEQVQRDDFDPVRHYSLEEGFGGNLFRCCFVDEGHVNYGSVETMGRPEEFLEWAIETENRRSATPRR